MKKGINNVANVETGLCEREKGRSELDVKVPPWGASVQPPAFHLSALAELAAVSHRRRR